MGRIRIAMGSAAVVVIGLAAVACGSSGSMSGAPSGTGAGGEAAGRGWTDCPSGSCTWSDEKATARTKGRGPGVVTGGNETGGAANQPAPRQTTTTASNAPRQSRSPAGPVYASAVDDNALWDDYVAYTREFDASHPGAAVERVPIENRKVVTVVDDQGKPVRGADVLVTGPDGAKLAMLKTYADGRAVFFPAERVDLGITAARGTASVQAGLPAGQSDIRLTLSGATRTMQPQVDVLFLLDTTSSMGDEIDQLKQNMEQVARQVGAESSRPRFGLTLYRDRGDLFGTRTYDLTDDLSSFRSALQQVQAGGGGDTPEDLTAGLHDALAKPSWRDDNTIKVIVLVGDAPPHVDYGGRYADEVQRAQASGVKVLAIGALGMDDPGEYVFRQLGSQTMGRYVFLANGPTGGGGGRTPGSSLSSGSGALPLDQLVAQLIVDELRTASRSGT